MADIYARSERMKFRWRDQAEEDPLTGLPNLRALESHLQRNPAVAISSLRIQNLDFLSRHYGMMMSGEQTADSPEATAAISSRRANISAPRQ